MTKVSNRQPDEPLLINELQLLLAEKRTYFALLRTGIAIFTLSLSILGFLVATSGYHGLFKNFWIAYPGTVGLVIISVIGLVISIHANQKIKKIDRFIEHIRGENKRIAEILV